jgi:signal transduction histidine kinase
VSQTLVAVQLKSGVEPHREALDVAELIEDIQTVSLVVRGIELHASVEPGLHVHADPRLLGSALTNLVQNAIKFTRNDGHIEIRGKHVDAGICIEVEDECGGLTVPPEDLFVPFVQACKRRSGVGLGLTITRDAIEAHGGTLSVENLPGKGCVFRVQLPAS